MSVSATSTPVTRTKKEAVKAVKTAGADKDGKESKSEYPENFTRVLCIWYPITFRKKSVLVSALLESSNEVNTIHHIFSGTRASH